GGFAGLLAVAGGKGNGAHAGVAAATIALADFGQVDLGVHRSPGIGSHRDLSAEVALAQPHAVHAFGVEVVGDKFVVALVIAVADVEENGTIAELDALPHDFNRLLMAVHEGRQKRRHEGLAQDLFQGFAGQQRNEAHDEAGLLSGFNDHGELHGGRLHLYRRLGVGIEGAVDYVGPLHHFRHRSRVKTKPLFRHRGNEAGAGFEVGVVELAVTLVVLEGGRVLRAEEGALMVVKPPGYLGRRGVLEIHNGVFVAIKFVFIKQRTGAVQETAEHELGIGADALAVETGKQRRGAGPVETAVVVENAYAHSSPVLETIYRRLPGRAGKQK